MGQVLTAGTGQNPSRQAAINAGISISKPAYIVNQVCGSGLRAVISGYQSIKLGVKKCYFWRPRKYVNSSRLTFEKDKKIFKGRIIRCDDERWFDGCI